MTGIMVPATERDRAVAAFKSKLYEKGINPRSVTERANLFEEGFFEAAAVAERNGRTLANEALDVEKSYKAILKEINALKTDAASIERFCERLMMVYEEDSPAEDRLEKMIETLRDWVKPFVVSA